jgi:hypothetical protein
MTAFAPNEWSNMIGTRSSEVAAKQEQKARKAIVGRYKHNA